MPSISIDTSAEKMLAPNKIFKIRNILLTGVCLGLMTGCSWLDDWPPKGSEMARKTAPKPPVASKQAEETSKKWVDTSKSTNNAVPQAASKMADAKNISIDGDASQRIAQLEESVAKISNDLSMMMPALTKIAASQGNLEKTISSVEPAAGTAAIPAANPSPVASAPVNAGPQPGSIAWYEEQERLKRQQNQSPVATMSPAQVYTPPVAPAQAQPSMQSQYVQPYHQQAASLQAHAPVPAQYQQASYGGAQGASVNNIRFGEHTDKTRIVLDTSAKVSYSYNVDNNERMIVVNLPSSSWFGAQQMNVMSSPLVASYNVVPDQQGGQNLIIQLKRPAKVLWAQALDPSGAQGNRIVLDVAPI